MSNYIGIERETLQGLTNGVHTIYNGECIRFTPRMSDHIELIYMDPPYGPVGEDVYFGQGEDAAAYLFWIEQQIRAITLGIDDYNIIVHVDPKYSHYIKVRMDAILGRENFRNEIVWCYCGPSNAKAALPKKHDVLLWYGVGDYVLNMPHVPYKALGTAVGSAWGGISAARHAELLARGKKLEDFWIDIPALVRNEKEKVGYPTQKPVALLRRLVRMLTSVHGTVLDPMAGSGTTGMACDLDGRQAILIEKNYEAFKGIMKSLP